MSKEVPKIRFVNFQDIWDNSSFEDAFDLSLSTNTLSRAKLNYTENGIKNIHYGDILINYGAIVDPNIDSIPTIIDGKIEKYKANLLMDGDLIFADAAEDYSVGKAVEIRGLETHYVVAGLHTIIARPKKTFSNYYLGYYINSDKFHDKLLRLVQGTKVSSLSKSSLKKTSIYYPAKQAEQQQIGLFFKKIDDLINVSQRELDLLQETKKAFMQKLFPKAGDNIPDLRFEGFVGDWRKRELGTLGKVITGNTPSTSDIDNWSSNNSRYVWITPSDIDRLVMSDSERHLTEKGWKIGRVVPENSVLITSIASIGKNAINTVPVAFNQQINAIVPNGNDAYFILTIMERDKLRFSLLAGQTATAIINKTTFEKFRINVPEHKEQEKTGFFFKDLDNLITLYQRQLDNYKELKKGFLQKMFV